MSSLNAKIQLRKDTQANWVSSDPVLLSGEVAISTDQLHAGTDQPKFKIGNGTDVWSALDYYPIGSGSSTWGSITGTLSNQTDLQNALNGKQSTLTNPVTGTGTANELAYWTGVGTIGSLAVATYPSLTELSYVKGLTSSLQTQLNGKVSDSGDTMSGLLQFSGTTHAGIRLISLTTAQRNALTPAAGDHVWDTSLGCICTYNGTYWEYEVLIKVTTGTQTTTSASAQNITDLVTPTLEANARYEVLGLLNITCNNTGGVKFAVVIPTAATTALWYSGRGGGITAYVQTASMSSGTLTGTAHCSFSGGAGILVQGELTTGANTGTIQFQFASGTSGQTSSIIQQGSIIRVRRIA